MYTCPYSEGSHKYLKVHILYTSQSLDTPILIVLPKPQPAVLLLLNHYEKQQEIPPENPSINKKDPSLWLWNIKCLLLLQSAKLQPF